MSGQSRRREPGAVLTRRMLPAMVVLILAGAFVRWLGERAGLYRFVIGLGLMVGLMILLTVLLVLWTGRVLDEAQRRSEEALRESERRFRSLIENSHEITVILDPDATVRYQSPSVERILGWPPGEMLGRVGFQFLHDDDVDEVSASLAELAAEPRGIATRRVRCSHRDGDVRTVDFVAENLLDDPAVSGIVVTGRDVTERARLEEELRRGQRLEAVGRLAGGVAHDFNNLLVVIQGYASLLKQRHGDGEGGEGLDEILAASERAARLVRQLLAFSGRQVLQHRAVSLNGIVSGLDVLLRPLVGEAVELRLDLEPGLSDVLADPGQIEQVVMNLAANARDAMPEGGALTICTADVVLEHENLGPAGLSPGRYATLTVVDEGVGMDEETRARIFEPFFSTKGPEGGTGLGLATAYGIVAQSGGAIVVDSEPGRGSAFTVYLPAATGVTAVPPVLPG